MDNQSSASSSQSDYEFDSSLAELFPSLGDLPGTNPLALLLTSLSGSGGGGDDRGASLYNPFNLPRPRLHEIHALATASLISQTQEAIMHEYNISQDELGGVNSSTQSHSATLSPEKYSLESFNKSVDTPVKLPVKHSDASFKCNDQELGHRSRTPCGTDMQISVEAFNSINSLLDNDEAISVKPDVGKDTSCFQNPVVGKKSERQLVTCDRELNFAVQNIPPKENVVEYVEVKDMPQVVNCPTVIIEKSKGAPNLLNSNELSNEDNITVQNGLMSLPTDIEQKKDQTVIFLDEDFKQAKTDEFPLDSEHVNLKVGSDPDIHNKRVLFVCHICLKHFMSESLLEEHMTGHLQYVCPQPGCVRTFAYRSHLHYHLNTHSGSRSHRCQECGCVFSTAQHLAAHQRTHAGDRPYPCTQCGRAFTTLSQLNSHARTHTGEKPYKCEVANCGKSFAESSSLKKHKVTHSGEKPYKCSICGKGFTQTSSRGYHMKKAHKDTAKP
ncbi:oocyte zinc finger protein XlCOF8.4-like [Mya arenaria]|uniref:oocyte zinc finger protein XlCOF8.4-like n=1 Tax=Mya arenaria TaxID=6604 RepID=UPI0022E8E583|nr:oocyte zinc finger protein XlCOF8.4-like [Mya arenaria]XP_052768806.1 oocyte zinc finger protein XlCOF8.4-like [Mya arenaria]